MYGYAEIATEEVGTVNGSIGTTHAESVDVAAKTLAREQAYQRKRLRLLCAPTRMLSAQGETATTAIRQTAMGIDKNKVMKIALVGLIGYLALKGLRG